MKYFLGFLYLVWEIHLVIWKFDPQFDFPLFFTPDEPFLPPSATFASTGLRRSFAQKHGGLTWIAFVVVVVFGARHAVRPRLRRDQLPLADQGLCDITVQRGQTQQKRRTAAHRHQQQSRQPAVPTPPGGLPQRVPPEREERSGSSVRLLTGRIQERWPAASPAMGS